MRHTLEQIRSLQQSTLQRITGSAAEWTGFLTAAARFYKYPFAEQLLIYAQAPNAAACADGYIWEKVMRRTISPKAKYIALVEENAVETYLKYVFDISDTREKSDSRPVRIWLLRKQQHSAVAEMLEQNYHVSAEDGLRKQLLRVADQLSRECSSIDYGNHDLFDIGRIVLYNKEKELLFSRAVAASVGYVLLARCGLQPGEAFPLGQFEEISRFRSIQDITSLGNTVSTLSEHVLRQIETSVKGLERSISYGKNSTRADGRDIPGGRTDDRQIRQDARAVPEGAPAGGVPPLGGNSGADRIPSGYSGNSVESPAHDDAVSGGGGGSDRAAQENRPVEMGRPDEQLQSAGGGDHLSGTDLRIIETPKEAEHGEKPVSASFSSQAGNFHITDDRLGVGSASVKFRYNIEAITTLHQVEAESRKATPEEQKILSRYVGWGSLADCFDTRHSKYQELRAKLTDAEFTAARASTLNAHYTSPLVIRAIYDVVGRLGFQTGRILEPACGIGNFFGCLPTEMRNSRLYGVELDSLTARIAAQLYPHAEITAGGFETTDRRDFFDLAVGNVPFGQYQVDDPAYRKLGFSIHDYFFCKDARSGTLWRYHCLYHQPLHDG